MQAGRVVAGAAQELAEAAVIGSTVYSLPPECVTVVSGGVTYRQCGSTWYEPHYAGSSVEYIVVNPPY
jgi:hypothetical protein